MDALSVTSAAISAMAILNVVVRSASSCAHTIQAATREQPDLFVLCCLDKLVGPSRLREFRGIVRVLGVAVLLGKVGMSPAFRVVIFG